MKIARGFGFGLLLLNLLLAGSVTASAGEESERALAALEKEVKSLKGTVDRLSRPSEQTDFDPPKLQLRGFGHLQYDFDNRGTKDSSGNIATDRNANNFTNGGIDLFVTSQIARKLNFLSEIVFDFNDAGGTVPDVERVLVKYEYTDWLNVSMGRGHTALGFWNQRYHHGIWLATTALRPIIYRFEDEGGILPVHFEGIEFSGNLNTGIGNLTYMSNVANGRGRITDEVQMIKDDNTSKQVSFMFALEPNAVKGLGFGANILHDVIPNNANVAGRDREIEEVIGGVHAYYLDDHFELIGELQTIQHDSDVRKFHSGGYAQLAYAFDKIKPYYRFDFLDIKTGDVFFAGIAGVEDTKQHTFGVRYELFPYAALKVEFRRADATTFRSNAATAQISFAF
ncbi:MAG: hypothetical protein HZA02_04240 [Nitrospinae bacterium]|nr:hypothetical protein [Nitrospinota bacterium]